MRLFILILGSMIIFSCNNSGGTGFSDEYLDELDNGNGNSTGDIYTLTGSIQYENSDCSGSETFVSGMCTAENENDPDGITCLFMNFIEDTQLIEQSCDQESACVFISYFDMMPITLTFYNDGNLDYSIGEFCSNVFLTSENMCLSQGQSWNSATTVEGTCNENDDTIICNSDMSDEPLIFLRIDSNTIVGQNIDVDEYGNTSCQGIVLTKQ